MARANPGQSPNVAGEVEWLFTQCESEFGIKSNFPAMLIACKIGGRKLGGRRSGAGEDSGELVDELHNEDAIIDAIDTRAQRSRFAAAARNRRVMAAFTRLEPAHQRVFAAAYEARQRPPQVRQAFGHLAGVAPLTATARGVRGFSMAWLARAIGRGDPRAKQIRAEAEKLFNAAVAAYGRAREAA